MEQCSTAASYDAFSYCSASCVESVFNAQFLFFQFNFGSSTNFDNCNAASQFSQTFLEFFFIEFRSGFRNLRTDLCYATSDFFFVASTVNDGGHFFGNAYLTSLTKVFYRSAVQFTANFFADYGCTGKDSDILEHSFTTVTEARSFNSNSFEGTTEFVYYEGCQCFAFNVFSDDEQFTTTLNNFFQNRHNVLNHGDFAVSDEHQGVVQNSFHFVRVSCHVGRDVATVKLHAFYSFQASFHGFGFFNGDYAVVANFFHSVCNETTNFFVSCGDGSNLCFSFFGFYFLRNSFQFFNQNVYCFLDTFFQNHGVSASCYVFHAFANHSLSKYGSGGGAVASNVVGFDGYFFNQLRTHIFKRIFQFNITSNGYAVVSDGGRTKFLFQYYVTTFGAKSYFYSVSQCIYATFQAAASFFIKQNLFCHFTYLLSLG